MLDFTLDNPEGYIKMEIGINEANGSSSHPYPPPSVFDVKLLLFPTEFLETYMLWFQFSTIDIINNIITHYVALLFNFRSI